MLVFPIFFYTPTRETPTGFYTDLQPEKGTTFGRSLSPYSS